MSSLSERLESARLAVEPAEGPYTQKRPAQKRITEEPEPQQVDAFATVKARAVNSLFESIGTRISDSSLTEEQLQGYVREELTRIVGSEQLLLTADERQRLILDIEDDALGLGPLQRLLHDPTVTEIMVNGHDRIYVERGGRLIESGLRFGSEEHLRRVIERIVANVGRRIDESSPLVDARLSDGSRVNAVIPPLAVHGSSLTIRKFSETPLQVADLIRFRSMTQPMAELLNACVQARLNIIVSGGTGTGKTTLLNVLSSFIPTDERIVTIEDAIELKLQQDHVVSLESRPPNVEGKGEITIRDLVRNSLRMRPDRIVVGEVRGGESLDMLQAMNTGHDGSLSTVHANSPRDSISRSGDPGADGRHGSAAACGPGADRLGCRPDRAADAPARRHPAGDPRDRGARDGAGHRRPAGHLPVRLRGGHRRSRATSWACRSSPGFGRASSTSSTSTALRTRLRASCRRWVASDDSRPWALLATLGAFGLVSFALMAPTVGKVALSRRRPPGTEAMPPLRAISEGLVNLVDSVLKRRGWVPFPSAEIEMASLRMTAGSLVVFVSALAFTAFLLGSAFSGHILVGLLAALLVPAVTKVVLRWRGNKRRAAFGDQLDESLQMIASALRAGHSLARALDTASRRGPGADVGGVRSHRQ